MPNTSLGTVDAINDIDDIDALPGHVALVRVTEEFDETTVPAGLLRDHRVATGVWGRLVVIAGTLRFGFADEPEFEVGAGSAVVIPPTVVHHVAVSVPVRFAVEFYR